jgi:hypothetical protein
MSVKYITIEFAINTEDYTDDLSKEDQQLDLVRSILIGESDPPEIVAITIDKGRTYVVAV